MATTYEMSGVSIQAGDEFVARIKEMVRSTFSQSVLTDIGAFGAFYDARFTTFREPVLVSSVDGVGTKLKIAALAEKHDTIGADLVNHCVNDIAVCGATPLYFLDYFAAGKLNIQVAEDVVSGMVRACLENKCSLVGGETAEMPGMYREGEYDLAGTIVGIVEKKKIFNGRKVRQGDVVIGLPSTGLHTNGYSLARTVLFERFEIDDFIDELGMTLGEALLTLHRSYLDAITSVRSTPGVHGFAHVTGGGIVGNTKRIVPAEFDIAIDWRVWHRPAIFQIIQRYGDVPEEDMRRTFNLGIGLVIIVAPRVADRVCRILMSKGEKPVIFGEIVPGRQR